MSPALAARTIVTPLQPETTIPQRHSPMPAVRRRCRGDVRLIEVPAMSRTSPLQRLRTAGIGLCLCGMVVSGWSGVTIVRAANAGDILVDSAGQPAPNGHETDPHLSCA